MAKFEIHIKHGNNLIPLTVFETNQESILNFATFNEQLTLNNYGQFSLTFNMARYLFQGNEKIENHAAAIIQHGTQIQLTDRYQDVYLGTVTNIQYAFSSENIIISYTVNDLFSTELSKRNVGYSLNSDPEAIDYIGAMTLDSWARRIIKDCNITWSYTSVDTMTDDILRFANQSTYNTIQSFSVDTSNAFDALKTLAESYGMDIKVNGQHHSFGFIPLKNPRDKGLRFSPVLNLANLDLSTDSQSLVTVLNVKGVTMPNNEYLTILPTIPPRIFSWFGTEDWAESIFEANLYHNYLNSQITDSAPLTATEQEFLTTVHYVPMLENKLINLEYYLNPSFLTESNYNELYSWIFNELRRANGKLIYYRSEMLEAQTFSNNFWNDFTINSRLVHAAWESGYEAFIKDTSSTDKNILFQGFTQNYNDMFNGFSPQFDSIINWDNYATDFFRKYFNTYQTFLAAIYDFRKYWEEPSTEVGQTNREYYYAFTQLLSPSDDEIQKAAKITSTLSGYWEQAVTAGKYAGFWLPSNWDTIKTWNGDPAKDVHCRPIDYVGELNPSVIPEVEMIKYGSQNILTDVNWQWNTEEKLDDTFRNQDTLIDLNNVIKTSWVSSVINGITFTNNGDGSWTVSGTATATATKGLTSFSIEEGTVLYLRGCPSGGSNDTYRIIDAWHTNMSDTGQGDYKKFTSPVANFQIGIQIRNGTTVNNLVFKPQLLNLTEIFGAGNEPTQQQIESLLNVLNLDYIPYDTQNVRAAIEWYPDAVKSIDLIYMPSYIQGKDIYYQIKTGFSKIYYNYTLVPNYHTYYEINQRIGWPDDYKWMRGLYYAAVLCMEVVQPKKLENYYNALDERDGIWTKIYEKYGHLIQENYYEDSTSTTPELLLENARIQFEFLSKPEPNYAVSIIDIYNIDNTGLNKIEITDQISIESDIIESKPNEIRRLLSEKLYVSGISHDLRSDADISLIVNPIRYDDKLIKRLVKLL